MELKIKMAYNGGGFRNGDMVLVDDEYLIAATPSGVYRIDKIDALPDEDSPLLVYKKLDKKQYKYIGDGCYLVDIAAKKIKRVLYLDGRLFMEPGSESYKVIRDYGPGIKLEKIVIEQIGARSLLVSSKVVNDLYHDKYTTFSEPDAKITFLGVTMDQIEKHPEELTQPILSIDVKYYTGDLSLEDVTRFTALTLSSGETDLSGSSISLGKLYIVPVINLKIRRIGHLVIASGLRLYYDDSNPPVPFIAATYYKKGKKYNVYLDALYDKPESISPQTVLDKIRENLKKDEEN